MYHKLMRKLVLSVCSCLVLSAGSAFAQNAVVTVAVDAAADRHPINPNIYGVAFGSASALAGINAPLNRFGGNTATRYNWRLNAFNHASDFYFESIGESSAVAGAAGDDFVAASKGGGAQPMITVPMIGWVAKLGANRAKLASFSQAKYGEQTAADHPYFPDAGNGILKSTGKYVAGNDPNDADVSCDSSFQKTWIEHLAGKWGDSLHGGVRYYFTDNEPSIWFSTHRDVHPTGPTMAEIEGKIVDYATRIKEADPGALVAGPEEWGWGGYLYSGYDQQWGASHNYTGYPDRAAHGGQDYIPWLLDQLKRVSLPGGRRVLDALTVHYYPQGGEFGDDVSAAKQLLRNRSTRSLWDPNYVDESWIHDKVRLIPRLREWAGRHYFPGTPIGVTEYNWGAEGHINGATAQADVEGIFGREGLDYGVRWTTPGATTPVYKAMQMYRNYDGHGGAFGDISVRAAAPNPDNLSAFAAVRTGDGALTVMVINKVPAGTTDCALQMSHFAAGAQAHVWQMTSANAIKQGADLHVADGNLSLTLPAQSITLFVVPPAN